MRGVRGERGRERGAREVGGGKSGVWERKPLNSKLMIIVVELTIDMIRLNRCQSPSTWRKKQQKYVVTNTIMKIVSERKRINRQKVLTNDF